MVNEIDNKVNENIKNWKDLSTDEIANALKSENYLDTLKKAYPNVNFNELEQIKEKYKVIIKCPYCGNEIIENYYVGLIGFCLECKRKIDVSNYYLPGVIANWFIKYYDVATTENGEMYLYNKEKGIWEMEKLDAVLKKELKIIYKENLTTQKFNNVKLNIQAITFIPKQNFSNAIKQNGNEILINLKNGVLHIPSFQLENHNPNYYFTKYLDINYIPNADIPEKFLKFLVEISNNQINFINLLEAFSYPLLPNYPIQRAIVLLGEGNNGKSTYLKLLENFYGIENTAHLSLQQLSEMSGKQPFGLLKLKDKLLNIVDDLPYSPIYDTGYFKQLTGGSTIEGEKKFGDRVSFTNSAKFFFSANRMPLVSENTTAFFRRFHFIEFTKKIENPKEQNELINEILNENEKSKMLNLLLAIAFFKLKQKNDFTFSKSVEEIEEQYQKHSNTAQLFFEKMVYYDPNNQISKEELFKEYEKFCESEGLMEVSQKLFWQTFKKLFSNDVMERKIQIEGIQKRFLIGIKVENEKSNNILETNIENYNENIIDNYFNIENIKVANISNISNISFIFNLFYNTSLYFKEINTKSWISCPSCQDNINTNNLLDNIYIGFDKNKIRVILHLIENKEFSNIIDLENINSIAKKLLNINFNLFENENEIKEIIDKLKENGIIYFNPNDMLYHIR
jgi:P4 family phage/plasmid primase-like protien